MTRLESLHKLVTLVVAVLLLIAITPSTATPHRRQEISDSASNVSDNFSSSTTEAAVQESESIEDGDSNPDVTSSNMAGVSLEETATVTFVENFTDDSATAEVVDEKTDTVAEINTDSAVAEATDAATDSDSNLESDVSMAASEAVESDAVESGEAESDAVESGGVESGFVESEGPESDSIPSAMESDSIASADRPLRFAVVQHSNCVWDESWCEYERGMNYTAGTLDVSLDYYGPISSADTNSISEYLEQAIDANPDGIALTISNEQEVLEGLKRAKELDIPVMVFESGPDLSFSPLLEGLYETRYGINDYGTGLQVGQVMGIAAFQANLTADVVTGICINDRPNVLASNERCVGVANAFNTSGYTSTILNFTYDAENLVEDNVERKDQIAALMDELMEEGFRVFLITSSGNSGAEAFYAYLPESNVSSYAYIFATFGKSEVIMEGLMTDPLSIGAVNDQPYAQGAGVITGLNMDVRYGIEPVDMLVETGPIFYDGDDYDELVGSFYIVDGPINLIAIQHGSCEYSEFWCTVENGINNASIALGVTTDIRAADRDDINMTSMAQLIEAAILEKPDGLLVTIPNAEALQTQLQAAVDAGIPVMAYNAGGSPAADKIEYMTLIAQDNYLAGERAGEELVKAYKEKGLTGKAACILANPNETNLNERCLGFEQVVAAANITHVRVSIVGPKEAIAATMENYYTNNTDTDMWLTATLKLTDAFYNLVDEQQIASDSFVHGGFDVNTNIMQAIEEGISEFTVDQQPYIEGYGVVAQMTLLLRENIHPFSDFVATGPGLIFAEDVPEVEALAGVYRRSLSEDHASE